MEYVHIKKHDKFTGGCSYDRKVKSPKGDILIISTNDTTIVPGYLVREEYRETKEGLKVSQVEPIPDEDRSDVEKLVIKHFAALSQKVWGDPNKIETGPINFW